MKKQWSKEHDKCLSCKTKKLIHYAKGLCSRCYASSSYYKDPQKQLEYNKNWAEKNPERHKELLAKAQKEYRIRNKLVRKSVSVS